MPTILHFLPKQIGPAFIWMEDEEFSFYQASVVDRDILDVIKSVEAANSVTLSNESVFQMIERMISAVEIKVLKNIICDRNRVYSR